MNPAGDFRPFLGRLSEVKSCFSFEPAELAGMVCLVSVVDSL